MITTWSEGTADLHMDEEILTRLGTLVQRHPWWQARAQLTMALLSRLGVLPPARVLDAGCGWGVTLDLLERCGYRPVGLDVSRHTLTRLDKPGRELVEADLTAPLPSDVAPFDVVLALDVIEHLDDDRSAVGRLGQLARPGGGVVVVSVPARPELYSEFDSIQGHRRRYLPDRLRAAFLDSGLQLEQLFWWGAWMLPLLRLQRGRRRATRLESPAEAYRRYLRIPPWPASWAFRFAFALEQPLALNERLRTGTSLFAVARRL
jgi:SAM-dependent methyltransferase